MLSAATFLKSFTTISPNHLSLQSGIQMIEVIEDSDITSWFSFFYLRRYELEALTSVKI